MTRAFSCLLLEDDDGFASMIHEAVTGSGDSVTRASSVGEAREAIRSRAFDYAILDNRLPDGTGYEFHAELSRQLPECIAVMATGMPELSQAIALTRNGLFDYLTKPITVEALDACLARVRKRLGLSGGLGWDGGGEFLGDSVAIHELMRLLRQAARHPTAIVLIHGETGTGKDLAARTLHRLTFPPDGRGAPFVPLNCSALPEAMFEAELFGAEKGAYTGADRRRVGLAETAGVGTLFLDEMGEIPLSQQAKLLRFLEAREFRPLGSSIPRTFEGRFIAATNRDLAKEVREGRFRSDLLYRLDVLSVRLPALREHLGDLEVIAQGLVSQLAAKYRREPLHLKPEDLAVLAAHDFPGNVRELRNLLERSLLRTDESSRWLTLDRSGLPAAAIRVGPAAGVRLPAAPAKQTSTVATEASDGDKPASLAAPVGDFEPPPHRQLSPVEAVEYRLIAQTLREESGAIRRTALKLGLTHQALLRRLQKWPELRSVVETTAS